jgi:hypothetical protein
VETREGICLVVFTLLVDNGHVWLIGSKILSPASLAAGEILLSEEIAEAVVVSVKDEVLATFQVVPEDFNCVDDG